MKGVFVETSGFTAAVDEYFVDDLRYQEVQEFLLERPDAGAVMKGCGGLRKLRWPDPRRGKGKRGGLRVIYLHIPEADRFLMLDVYNKDEADDLTQDERRGLAGLAKSYREALKETGKE